MPTMWWVRGMLINPENGLREILDRRVFLVKAPTWQEAIKICQKNLDPDEVPGLELGEAGLSVDIVEFIDGAGNIAYV